MLDTTLAMAPSNSLIRLHFNDIVIEAWVMGQAPISSPLLEHNRYVPIYQQVTIGYQARTGGWADLGPGDELVCLLCTEEGSANSDDFVESRATLSVRSNI